ncbi:MAG: class I SAM-dependent methyltransferase [Thermodesulfobacteriota bacterium]
MILYLEKSGEITRDSSNLWLSSRPHSTKDLSARNYGNDRHPYRGYYESIPIPHPLDFEWRFSTPALDFLIQGILNETNRNDSILLLGTPTLYVHLCQLNLERKIVLVEGNSPIVSGLQQFSDNRYKLIEGDVFTVSPKKLGQYDCVVMDPPWYYDQFHSFTWLGSKVLRIGGTLFISLPPLGTRLGIETERIEFISLCHDLGFFLENLESQKLPYVTPFFEYNALKANSLDNLDPFWRKGDFAFFKMTGGSKEKKPEYISPYSSWLERIIQGVRFKVSSQSVSNRESSELLESIVEGDILPSVSTRDPRRSLANIWTSGNRIFRSTDVPTILHCLDLIIEKTKQRLDSKKKRDNKLNKLINFLSGIVKKEKEEYKNYMEWIFYAIEKGNFK